eukprot:4575157-Karenia_brevis.AAC.1
MDKQACEMLKNVKQQLVGYSVGDRTVKRVPDNVHVSPVKLASKVHEHIDNFAAHMFHHTMVI